MQAYDSLCALAYPVPLALSSITAGIHQAVPDMTDQPPSGKEGVNIRAIEPQGRYAVRLLFDDGHDTGIDSWDTLYRLGLE